MQPPLIINADCIHICVFLWSTVQFLNIAKYRKYTDQGRQPNSDQEAGMTDRHSGFRRSGFGRSGLDVRGLDVRG